MKDERQKRWKTGLIYEKWKTYKIKTERLRTKEYERHNERQDWWIKYEGHKKIDSIVMQDERHIELKTSLMNERHTKWKTGLTWPQREWMKDRKSDYSDMPPSQGDRISSFTIV